MEILADFRAVALAVARRNLTHAFKNPALLVPAALFPLVFLLAFAGGLSAVRTVPGFDYPAGYTAFQFVFVFLQAAAFGGVFTGFAVAGDFESGFTQRLLLASPRRAGLIAGYVLAGLGRFALTGTIVFVAALAAGMQVEGDPAHLAGLVTLALLLNVVATLFGTGLSMRAQTMQVAPLVQIPVFLILFMAPVYVPLELLEGWIATAASVNPATALLEAGRGFLAGRPDGGPVAFGVGVAGVALLGLFAVRGLRRAERGV